MKTISLLLALTLFEATALAQDCKEAYQVGKDIQNLRNEVDQIKATLGQLMELDRQRTLLLEKALGEKLTSPVTTVVKIDPPPPPSDTQKETDGTITGQVKLLEGSKIAYVYVDNVGGRLARGRTVRITQKNRQFEPRHLVVQKGTTVEFPNEDGIYHNVFSSTPGSTFDLGIYRKGDAAKSYSFMQAGLIEVFCNMHAKMNAEVLVVPNHLYTKVRTDGTFKLVRVPAGKRKIIAWAPGAELASGFVEVGPEPSTITLSLTPKKAGAHLNKSGQPYGSYQ